MWAWLVAMWKKWLWKLNCLNNTTWMIFLPSHLLELLKVYVQKIRHLRKKIWQVWAQHAALHVVIAPQLLKNRLPSSTVANESIGILPPKTNRISNAIGHWVILLFAWQVGSCWPFFFADFSLIIYYHISLQIAAQPASIPSSHNRAAPSSEFSRLEIIISNHKRNYIHNLDRDTIDTR